MLLILMLMYNKKNNYMKTIRVLRVLSMFFLVTILGCSTSDKEEGVEQVTSIVLTSDVTSFEEGGVAVFTVKTNLSEEVTSNAIISIDGTPISGKSFTSNNAGTYKVEAKYNELKSNVLTLTVTPKLTSEVVSIEVIPNVTTTEIGGLVVFTANATLKNNTNVDKTESATFYVNGKAIEGDKYLLTNLGENKVKALLNSIESNEAKVEVVQVSLPVNFTKKSVIEDYTGTWCGWCPRVSWAIELVKKQSDKVFSVGIHVENGDPMENEWSKAMRVAYAVNGFPTAYLNREVEWSYPEPNNINQAISYAQGTTNLGLRINSLQLNENLLDVVVNWGVVGNVSGAKIVLFVLEDKVVYKQSNYTKYYNGVNPIVNFEHDNVLRYSATNILGDDIDTSVGVHLQTFKIDLKDKKIHDKSKIKILAMLVDQTGKKVLNAQYAALGELKEFD